ncbi:hydrogenase small subunit [Limnochorda pilosa]|uniref:hydrogenase small subunit n=1 Tax=Limnochorda pilosa TaxID=1555112 RepID=UPI000AEDFC3A|nr:hydrogenase small subunit [Limnochorda pilosa]
MAGTVWDLFQSKGLSRRDFLRFCTAAAATLGLHASVVPRIARALENQPRPPVIWRHFQECTCCSESLIRASHPLVGDIILDMISLDYDELLMAPSGHRAEELAARTMETYRGQYILCVEGSVPTGDPAYCTIGGRSALDILREEAEGAAAVIAYGNCAAWGCVQSANPNPTGASGVPAVLRGKPVIQVPGCPPIAEVIAGVVVHLISFGRPPELDRQGRPLAFYRKRVHDTCVRRAYFDAGLFAESFDDEGYRQGWCLYKLGCKGPTTYNACALLRWNGGTSYPIQSGHPCLGCSAAGFWDQGPFYTKLADVPASALGRNPDRVGAAVVGAAVGAAAVHAGATAARRAQNRAAHRPNSSDTSVER